MRGHKAAESTFELVLQFWHPSGVRLASYFADDVTALHLHSLEERAAA